VQRPELWSIGHWRWRFAFRLLAVPAGWVFERYAVPRSALVLELPLGDRQGPIVSVSGEAVAQIGRAIAVALFLVCDEYGRERGPLDFLLQ
jgi:hypothetical protein